MEFRFQNLAGDPIDVPIGPGLVVFVIGANGSGKSSLMHKLFAANRNHARRISAHRQTWFQSNALDMTASGKRSTEQNMSSRDAQPDSRWMDHHGSQRASVTIFELIDSENVRARRITAAVDADDMDRVNELRKVESPLAALDELLKVANLPIEISIENDEQLFAQKSGGTPYSIAELSDGERNAILIAASVLTAKPGTLIIIDEPERHLHRSIVSPLLLALFEKRNDCGFVISTHDVSLPVDSPESSTLLLRSCTWTGTTASRWDSDLLAPDAPVSDEVRLAILGARRRLLFIEGNHDSLDRHIYSILYPSISIAPSGNSTSVERAVTGIRGSADVHWVTAFGLIDRDDRDAAAVEELRIRGIYALECYSVESLYYCEAIVQRVAHRQAQVAPDLANIAAARQAVVDHLLPHRERLCARLIEKRARVAVASNLPTHQSLLQNPIHTVTFDATGLIQAEQAKFDQLIAAQDIDGLISRYPARETPALGEVARHLGFSSKSKYESAVRKLLIDDEGARNIVKQKLQALTAAIEG
jgi:ABC-type cobalamin/Fe3+-siderophores transport system ATPase subunit